MLQVPSRGLRPAQTSGSPMTLFSAPAAGSASKADVNLECVETGQASGSARDIAPAPQAPSNALSNPNLKQTQHGNDRRFYFPDLLRAACFPPASDLGAGGLGAHVPTNSTTAHPVDHVVRVQGVVKIEKLPESPTMLQGPSRGLCSAQTSGSPMTLNSAPAAGSASKADVNLECVETGQASGSARDTAPALEAPSNAISNPNSKQTQHGNDRRFYFPDLLRAACHYRDHLPGDTQLHVIIARFPINPDGRLSVPESEAAVLLQDLHHAHCATNGPRTAGRTPWEPGPPPMARLRGAGLALMRGGGLLRSFRRRGIPCVVRRPSVGIFG